MAGKRLEWSKRADNDLEGIIRFYAETASPEVAAMARETIPTAVHRCAGGPVTHRPGKRSTRECVPRKFPYIVIYRIKPGSRRLHGREGRPLMR